MTDKPLSSNERYKLKQMEFKEENKKALCYVNLISTIVTAAMLIGTLVILNIEPGNCTDTRLRMTLWFMIGMHAVNITESVCGLTHLDAIFCGCICVVGFFAYEVAVLIYMQIIYYNGGHCSAANETPK